MDPFITSTMNTSHIGNDHNITINTKESLKGSRLDN